MSSPTNLRESVGELTGAANADLAAVWAQVSSAVEAREALADILPALIDTYGAAAGVMAAEWYDDLRSKLGIGGRFAAFPVEPIGKGAEALAGWGMGGPLFQEVPDLSSALSLIQGGLQRRIADVSRETVATASLSDPKARGWQRKAFGGCAFCQMLASRGAVYSVATARFASHDHCGCIAVPAFQGEPLLVKPYTPSLSRSTDADRARVRAWIASN